MILLDHGIPDCHVSFVDSLPSCGEKQKISCTGVLSASDWRKGHSSTFLLDIPVLKGIKTIHIEIDKTKHLLRASGESKTSSLDIVAELPKKEKLLDIDGMTVMGCVGEVQLKLSHVNEKRWWDLQLSLYKAGLEADLEMWSSTWSSMKKLAIEEESSAEDWSHNACRTALFALHECAWKNNGTPKGDDAVDLMGRLLADCDITSDEVVRLVQNGLSRGSMQSKIDVSFPWVRVNDDDDDFFKYKSTKLFVHSSITERFDMQCPVESINSFDFMPICIGTF